MVILLLHFHRFLLLSTRCYATIETFRRSCTQSTLCELADLVEPDGALLNMVYHDESISITSKVEFATFNGRKEYSVIEKSNLASAFLNSITF